MYSAVLRSQLCVKRVPLKLLVCALLLSCPALAACSAWPVQVRILLRSKALELLTEPLGPHPGTDWGIREGRGGGAEGRGEPASLTSLPNVSAPPVLCFAAPCRTSPPRGPCYERSPGKKAHSRKECL